jgi:glycosyltransferase involved in cell wall biosynthesis
MGVQASIAAASGREETYAHRGHAVYRFQTSRDLPLRALYGEGDPEAARSFAGILDTARPDILHMHAFTSGASIRLLRAAHERGIPVVFTYHTPTVSCARGTLLRWGAEPCEGRMEIRQCAACRLHDKGLSKTASRLVASLPSQVGRALGAVGASGRQWTALRAAELVGVRHGAVRALLAESDCIVAPCEWVRALLMRNGAEASRIVVTRQGLSQTATGCSARPTADQDPLRIAFLGRVARIKGLGVLLAALRMAPELRLTLDVFAVTQSRADEELKGRLVAAGSGDSRVRFPAPFSPHQTVERLRGYDVLAVPSQGLETGPLVVYEAFAAGIPVVGSDLGGIAELVTHEKNGLLVEASSRSAWAGALRRLAEDRGLLAALRAGIGPVRTMRDVAAEMMPIYERLQ